MSPRAPAAKLQSVDLVRSFSILAVMAYHLKNARVPAPLSPWALFLWNRFSNNGFLGVSVFFVVSGFLITRLIAQQPGGLFKPDKWSFYSRRVGRIIPLLAFACLAGAGMVYLTPAGTAQYGYCVKSPDAVLDPLHWLSIATFTFNWYVTFFSLHPYRGLQWDILWSLSIEEQFYLFYPLLLGRLGRARPLTWILIFFVLFGLAIRAMNLFLYPEFLSYNSFQNFDMMALGCLLYLASEKFRPFLAKSKKTCLALCLGGLWMAGALYFHIPPRPELGWYLFVRSLLGLGVFLFLLGAISQEWFESRALRPLALPGRLSYGMYLLHPLVLYFIWDRLTGETAWMGFLVFSAAATALAYGSYRLFEMPANLWVRKKLKTYAVRLS